MPSTCPPSNIWHSPTLFCVLKKVFYLQFILSLTGGQASFAEFAQPFIESAVFKQGGTYPTTSQVFEINDGYLLGILSDNQIELYIESQGNWILETTITPNFTMRYLTLDGLDIWNDQLAIGNPNSEEVAIYEKSDGIWNLIRKVSQPIDNFGRIVSIQNGILAVGTQTTNNVLFIYEKINGVWDYAGQSGIHDTELITQLDIDNGTIFASSGGKTWNSQKIRLYEKKNSVWSRIYTLSSWSNSYDGFATSFGVSNKILVTTAPHNRDLGYNRGAAYVFEKIGSTWEPSLILYPQNDGSGAGFGEARLEGNLLVLSGGTRISLYEKINGVWLFQQFLHSFELNKPMIGNISMSPNIIGCMTGFGIIHIFTPAENLKTNIEETFDAHPTDWTTGGSPSIFPLPNFSETTSSLRLTFNNFLNFGFWQSPAGYLSNLQAFNLIYVRAFVKSNIPACNIPEYRIRAFASDQSQSNLVGVASRGPCAYNMVSDVVTSHSLVFEAQGDALHADWQLAFDVVNFDPTDATSGDLELEEIEVFSFPRALLGYSHIESDYNFANGSLGWTAGNASPALSAPDAAFLIDSLSLTSHTNADSFGFWQNTPYGMTFDQGFLYKIRVDTSTSIPWSKPSSDFRVRLFSDTMDYYGQFIAPLYNSYDNNELTVDIYFESTNSLFNRSLYVAIDHININPAAPPITNLKIKRVLIEAFTFPTPP